MPNSIINHYLTRISLFAGEYIMPSYLREGVVNIEGESGIVQTSIMHEKTQMAFQFIIICVRSKYKTDL